MSQKQLGGVIEESLSAAKLIISFANEEKECEKISKRASEVRNIVVASEKFIAFFSSLMRGLIFAFYVYAFWIGT